MATYDGIIDFVNRISESGDIRISESGDTRISEEVGPESLIVDDSVLVLWASECVISESISVNDSVSVEVDISISESISVNDIDLSSWVAQCELSESATGNDSPLISWAAQCILTESGLINDIVYSLKSVISESIAVSEDVLVEIDLSMSESVNVSDIVLCSVIRNYAIMVIEGNETFAVGDILRIKTGEPGVLGDDEWLEVSNIVHAPQYGVIRDKGGDYAANMNPAWTKGAAVVNYGQSGDGGIYMTASDNNAPYLSIFSHAGSPWDTITTYVREGNLNGYAGYATDIYGWASYIDAENFIKIDPVNGISMSGSIDIQNWSSLDQTGLTNSAAAGATVGAIWGTNLSSIPATLGTPAGSGLFLSSTHMGFYTGGAWTSYLDSSGNFIFGDTGGGSQGISWNQGAGQLTIKGAITITSGAVPNAVITGLGGLALQDRGDLSYTDGADVTSANTAADTTAVNGLASTTIILAGKIGTGLVVANSINVGTLSAITANIGTCTAGIVKSSDDKLQLDLNNKVLKVYDTSNVLRVQLGYLP